ncbi:MAG: putative DNA binding domain-containing protein [Fusobacteriaceae bacterium]|jgi:ATP-dependent DNA helicase RecG|nr:putative DNA binding domain-containing protein [Fusobacteriaceae bacterium]
MLTLEELRELMMDLESDRIERTTAINDTDKFSKAVCAFANDYPDHNQPGYLLIGVNDNGTPAALQVTDRLLQNLGALRSDGNILPIPAISVYKIHIDDSSQVAVVEVRPSDLPPVRYKGQVWLRVGPRKAIASEQEERVLSERRARLITTFDARPVKEANITDISMRLFDEYRLQTVSPEIIAANNRTTEEKLASLRCFDLKSGTPTVAGILLFGDNPRYFLPGAYVQFLRLPGNSLTDRPIDQAEISGDLSTVLHELVERIRVNITTGLEPVSGLRERVAPDYPEVAVRELLLNAIMHRDYQSTAPVHFYWYADHIEIQNSGGLYGEVTMETLTKVSSYRNPIIAECMKALGYVNRYGYGIQRAKSLLEQNGNPQPAFEATDKYFHVTIYKGV